MPIASSIPRIVVIGGGITGLAAAHRLVELTDEGVLRADIVLLEGSDKLGGVISTQRSQEFLMELGPDSIITEKPWGLRLCERLGLDSQLIRPQTERQKLYTVHAGRLVPLPEGFLLMAPTQIGSMLRSPLFTWRGKLRMAADLGLPRRAGGSDESLASFVKRRLGTEVLERVAQPLIGGVYAADPDKLSLTATMPRFQQMERDHRSVILATRRTQKLRAQIQNESGARWTLFVSIGAGMAELVGRMEQKLPAGTVNLGQEAKRVTWNDAGKRWQVQTSTQELEADAVICAQPAFSAGNLLSRLDPLLAKELSEIPFASTATVNIAYKRSDIPHALNGFGFVVPFVEGRKIIACTFSSVKYNGRAPAGFELLRCFVGGTLQASLLEESDEVLQEYVRNELADLLGIKARPVLCHIERYPRSMPQYNVGHLERIQRIEERVSHFPRLALAGKSYRGVGIADCIHSGEEAAERIAEGVRGWSISDAAISCRCSSQ